MRNSLVSSEIVTDGSVAPVRREAMRSGAVRSRLWRSATLRAVPSTSARSRHRSLSTLQYEIPDDVERLRRAESVGMEHSHFAGAQSSFTTDPNFWHHATPAPAMPCFRIMDDSGAIVEGAEDPAWLTREHALAMMTSMVRVSEFDKIFLSAQRQGRISFYMSSRGEEAASVCSAAALLPQDWVLPQYRELGVFFWRGVTYEEVANQLCSNGLDPAHGRCARVLACSLRSLASPRPRVPSGVPRSVGTRRPSPTRTPPTAGNCPITPARRSSTSCTSRALWAHSAHRRRASPTV